jgi:methylenetetrahydrofolate--tRNA-(uracil-5-)-methyltransferase
MSGVEGYVESAASGRLAGIAASYRVRGGEPPFFPETTALGALGRYVARSDPARYQPTNVAFGLLPELAHRERDRAKKRLALARRALESLSRFAERLDAAGEAPAARAASSG